MEFPLIVVQLIVSVQQVAGFFKPISLNVDFLSSVRIPEGVLVLHCVSWGIGQSWRYSATSASVNWWTASTTREMTRSSQETFMKAASCSAHRTTSLIRSSMVVWFVALSIGYQVPPSPYLVPPDRLSQGSRSTKKGEGTTPPLLCVIKEPPMTLKGY